MHLSPGMRLGPYAIESLVGAGGMGEVYKAHDTRLDRVVALKILSPILAAHPELRERFEREARAISGVAHPNICTLFDLGRENGTDFLVMEFLEGETLDRRLERGALPFDHALSIAIDIASALEAAQRRGIVHRDLKPGNVMLVRRPGLSGAPVAKLLDFGLAKLATDAPAGGMSVVTAAQPLTQQGTILGTFQYMAPEQLEGGEADERSDIFAFGAMLYEMLTGRRAFQGKSQASLIGAILKEDPPAVSSIQAVTPPAVDRIVARCLAKDPNERWQTASDLAAELRWVQQGGAESASVAAAAPRVRRREILAWLLAAVGLTVAMALLGSRPQPVQQTDAMRFSIEEPPEMPFGGFAMAPFPVVSPDGKYIAFVTGSGRTAALALRSFAADTTQRLPGTDGAALPFWTPDSRAIVFVADHRLFRYALAGGVPQAIADAPLFEGGTCNRDGAVLFGTANGGLFKVPIQGGAVEQVTALNPSKGETSHRWPTFMPDGTHYVFIVQPNNVIRFASLGSKETKDLGTTEGRPLYANSGHLLFGAQGVLQARAFDPVRGAFSGDSVPLADNVRMLMQSARATYSVSDTGLVVYRTGTIGTITHVQRYDRFGTTATEALPFADYRSVSLSPDGTRIAFHRHDPADGGGVWVKDLVRGTTTRVTFGSHSYSEAWHPDGRHIAFSMSPPSPTANGATSLATIAMTVANGTGDLETLVKTDQPNVWPEWSPDGKVLLYETATSFGGQTDIQAMSMQTRTTTPYIHGPANEGQPAFSPDGKWVAYTSDESGRSEVYVQPYPATGDKWTISTSGGSQPQWRGDGKELFFLSLSKDLEAVETGMKSGRFDAATPHPLFTTRADQSAGPMSPFRAYAVARDGQSFLINEPPPDRNPRHDPLMVIVNWTALLRR